MDWKDIVKTVAPVLGGALGGPFGAAAARAVASAVLPADKVAGASEKDIAAAVAQADPAMLAAIKKSEQDFTAKMKELDVDLAKIGAQDVEGARQMQMATRSYMPAALTLYVLILLVLLLGWCIFGSHLGLPVPEGAAGNIIMIIVGLIIREATAAFQFWMGSSDGSKSKDAALAQSAQG